MVSHQSWDKIRYGPVVRIFSLHSGGPGSIPYDGILQLHFVIVWKNLTVLCFDVVVSLLAHNTSVEIGISILHLNKCKRWNLVPSIRSMPTLNKHFCTVFIWIIFLFTVEGELLLYGVTCFPCLSSSPYRSYPLLKEWKVPALYKRPFFPLTPIHSGYCLTPVSSFSSLFTPHLLTYPLDHVSFQ